MKPLIVANWKCNPTTLREAKALFNTVKNTGAVICPPFVYLSALRTTGAQDCFWKDSGAYTGEISPLMLKNMGVKYVIIGHSERRKHFKETDETIERKLKAALRSGLKPILCIDKISQIPKGIKNWKLKIGNLIVAYEPLFAIGTGKPYPMAKAQKMNQEIKRILGDDSPVLYGGSVNPQNARDYIRKAGFNGLVVGNASLRPQEFIDIVKNIC